MGLGKSKQPKPVQPGLPSQPGFTPQQSTQVQTGVQQMQVQPTYATSQAFPSTSYQIVQPNTYSSQPMQQSVFQTQPTNTYSQPQSYQTTATTAQQNSTTTPAVQQIYPNSMFSSQTSSYPVSYTNQQYRPLIPGYAPAPAAQDRRTSVMPQEQDKTDYSSRYYTIDTSIQQQQAQQPQQQAQQAQQQIQKARKH